MACKGRWYDVTSGQRAAATLPEQRGAYVLELVLAAPLSLAVGRLGRIELPAGRYRYYGSARGPGGLRARIARHLRRRKKQHWHVDRLTARARVTRVLAEAGGDEHALVQRDLPRGWQAPVASFGASDCRAGCPAHLLVIDGG